MQRATHAQGRTMFDFTVLIAAFILGAMIDASDGVFIFAVLVVGARSDAHIDEGVSE